MTTIVAAAVTGLVAIIGGLITIRGKRAESALSAAATEQAAYFESSTKFRSDLLSRIKELEDKSDERERKYEERMAAMDERNAKLSRDNDQLEAELRVAKARIAELEAEVARLKAQQQQVTP